MRDARKKAQAMDMDVRQRGDGSDVKSPDSGVASSSGYRRSQSVHGCQNDKNRLDIFEAARV